LGVFGHRDGSIYEYERRTADVYIVPSVRCVLMGTALLALPKRLRIVLYTAYCYSTSCVL